MQGFRRVLQNENESGCLEMWDGLLQKLASGEDFATPGDGLLLCYEETHKMLLERGKKTSAENKKLKKETEELALRVEHMEDVYLPDGFLTPLPP